jgi:aminoglycoside 3-N-acetyltransferase
MQTLKSLVEQLKKMGLQSGDLVMLHASLRGIGRVLGGPDQIHQAVMEAISPDGTLMMYVGCEPEFEAVGRNKLPPQEESMILQHCPAFDHKIARARRDYGMLAEFFRSFPGTVCSENPGARVAALGAKSDWLTANHPLQYGYGNHSPFEKLYANHGKLLLLGSDLNQVTLLHFAEHLAPVSNKRIAKFKVPLLKNEERIWCDVEEFDTSDGIRKWPERYFANIIERYLQQNSIRAFKIGNATSYLIDVKSLVDFAKDIFAKEANLHASH